MMLRMFSFLAYAGKFNKIMSDRSEKNSARHLVKSFRSFGRDERGVTVVEFALVVFPFLFLIFAIIELGLSFTVQQMLAHATEDVSRRFYTGQDTKENTTPEMVKDRICKKIRFMPVVDCNNLYINLDNYSTFSEVPVKNLVTSNGMLGRPSRINLGGPSTINQINVLYRWPVLTNIFYYFNPNVENKDRVLPLFTTVTWQNEPFS